MLCTDRVYVVWATPFVQRGLNRRGLPFCQLPRLLSGRTPSVWLIGKQLPPTSRDERQREQDAAKSDLRASFLLAGSRWLPVASRAFGPNNIPANQFDSIAGYPAPRAL